MKYKRQILLILFYSFCLLVAYFWGIGFKIDKTTRSPITQVYYISSLIYWYIIYFNLLSNLISSYVDGLKKKLMNQYPLYDSSELDFEVFEKKKFEKNQSKKIFPLVQPISCIIVCAPYLYYHLLHQYDLRILFGIFAHIAMLLLFTPYLTETIISRFLYVRHLDQLLTNPK